MSSAGLTLATRAPDIYRALIESTAFGTRVIIEAFETAGVGVAELVVAGGLMRNELYLMQIYADVTRRPLSLIGSAQGPRWARRSTRRSPPGAYPDIAGRRRGDGHDAQRRLHCPTRPARPSTTAVCRVRAAARLLRARGNEVLHRLRALRDRVLAQQASRILEGDRP